MCVDFNVPVDENFKITDDTRIRGALPTLKKILADGGSLIIASHMGRPKKNPDPKFSLKVVVDHVSKLLGTQVKFADECMGEKTAAMVKALQPGQALLLENLRFYAEEETARRLHLMRKRKQPKKQSKKVKKHLQLHWLPTPIAMLMMPSELHTEHMLPQP